MEPTPPPQYSLISDRSRVIVVLSGLGLLLASVLIFYWPPKRTTSETIRASDDSKVSTKETSTDADPNATASIMIIAGSALLAFGINGVKLTKFSSPMLNAEAAPLMPAALQPVSDVRPSLPVGQVDPLVIVRGYLNLSSWNGLKVLQIAMRAAERGGTFNFRDLCSQDSRMSHDYAFAYLVASSSLGLFVHSSDPGGVLIAVSNFIPVVRGELAATIEQRYASDPIDAPVKRAEIARIDAFFVPAR